MALQNVTQEGRIHARTLNSAYEGMVVMPGATRLKEFINRPCPTLNLTDVTVTTAPPGASRSPEEAPVITLYKSQILYLTLVEEIRRARTRVYERDVLAAHLKKELFTFQLDGGLLVTGEVVGGEHSVAFLKGMFLAVANPTVANLRGVDLLGALSFVLINLNRVEYYRPLSGEPGEPVQRSECEEPLAESAPVDTDFSEFEAQFVRLDRVKIKPPS
ncbi:MAG: hypothetical protein MUE60_05670 [Candidatus Eisenbacteria bacterium]|jgi:hypothetical protein|nr:hypothetical protein [Candidatus Eisenbacteria bacterium]